MTTWEYATLVNDLTGNVVHNTTGVTGADSTEVAANAGAAGWELVTGVTFDIDGTRLFASTFKRPTGTVATTLS